MGSLNDNSDVIRLPSFIESILKHLVLIYKIILYK